MALVVENAGLQDTQAPYNTRGTRDTLNGQDSIYSGGGNTTLLAPTGSIGVGYAATFRAGLTDAEITNTTATSSGGGPGGAGSMDAPPGGAGGQPPTSPCRPRSPRGPSVAWATGKRVVDGAASERSRQLVPTAVSVMALRARRTGVDAALAADC